MLRRSETLRTLGQMAIGIAHDLKNVLNPLGLHVALVERACDRAGVARPESLAKMREIIHHGVETIDRLRAFSRVEREAVADRFDLAAAAREALALAATRRDGRAELALVDETTEVGTVPGSRGDVVDAVLNLLVNAQEACAGGGRIVVTTGADAQAAWVAVADDGPGMAPEVRARAFDPFFTTKGEQGTGLGLANVYATARRHGGEVDLDTAPGAGARFTVRLPR
jgi:signal transduction histidine kinase